MEFIFVLFSIACAAFVQGSVGFGYGIISTALITVFLDVKDASVVMLLGGLAQNATIIHRVWADFSWKPVRGLVLTSACTVPLGVIFLLSFDSRLILFFLGILLIISALRPFASLSNPQITKPIIASPIGLMVGFLHGAFGAGAPPAVLYVRRLGFGRNQYVATLQIVLGASSLVRAVMMGGFGLMKSDLLVMSGIGIFFAAGGAYLGTRVLQIIPVRWLERATSALLLGLGMKYVITSL